LQHFSDCPNESFVRLESSIVHPHNLLPDTVLVEMGSLSSPSGISEISWATLLPPKKDGNLQPLLLPHTTFEDDDIADQS